MRTPEDARHCPMVGDCMYPHGEDGYYYEVRRVLTYGDLAIALVGDGAEWDGAATLKAWGCGDGVWVPVDGAATLSEGAT